MDMILSLESQRHDLDELVNVSKSWRTLDVG